MLNKNQLRNYRLLRGLSTREVAACCDVSQPMIVQAENGTKRLTEHTHDEIVKGINTAYKKKVEIYRKNKEEGNNTTKEIVTKRAKKAPVRKKKLED